MVNIRILTMKQKKVAQGVFYLMDETLKTISACMPQGIPLRNRIQSEEKLLLK